MLARLNLSRGVVACSKIKRSAPLGIDAVRNQRFHRSFRLNERLGRNVAPTQEITDRQVPEGHLSIPIQP
jgi:hypothetical protein